MVVETQEPGMTVSLVARRHGIAPNQLFHWRRLVGQGALTAAGHEEKVVPASQYRALQHQVRELQRLLGKKTLEGEILKDALDVATGSSQWPTSSSRNDFRWADFQNSVWGTWAITRDDEEPPCNRHRNP